MLRTHVGLGAMFSRLRWPTMQLRLRALAFAAPAIANKAMREPALVLAAL
jgi:hypothetical protein